MNNDELNHWEELRDRAESCLGSDFAHQVVQRSVRQKKLRQQQPRLALLTLAILFLVVNASYFWRAHEQEQQQLAQWEQWQSFQQVVLTSL